MALKGKVKTIYQDGINTIVVFDIIDDFTNSRLIENYSAPLQIETGKTKEECVDSVVNSVLNMLTDIKDRNATHQFSKSDINKLVDREVKFTEIPKPIAEVFDEEAMNTHRLTLKNLDVSKALTLEQTTAVINSLLVLMGLKK